MDASSAMRYMVLVGVIGVCFGQLNDFHRDAFVSKYVLLDMPRDVEVSQLHLVIRTNFKGSVTFKESDKLRVELNASAPSIQDLARIQHNFSLHQTATETPTLLLNVFDVEPPSDSMLIYFVGLFIASCTIAAFLYSIIYVCWFKMCRKPDDDDKTTNQGDSSQAPLLDACIPSHSGQSTANAALRGKAKKKCLKTPTHQVQTDESCVSSEDDLNETSTLPKKTPAPPKACGRRDKFEMNAFNSSYKTETMTSLPGPDAYLIPHCSDTMLTHADKIVSCIHMDNLVDGSNMPSSSSSSLLRKQPGQYISIGGGREKRFEVEDRSSCLRLRREPGGEHSDIPDVVRTRGVRGDVTSFGGEEIGGSTQYITLATSGIDNDPGTSMNPIEYRSLRENLTTTKLSNPIGGSMKHERPTVTFAPTSPKKSGHFDSYGRPRHTADEVRFATYTGARTKETSIMKRPKQHQQQQQHKQHHPQSGPIMLDDGTGTFNHFSPSSSSTDRSSDSGRMTDEAYGTLGSTVSNSTTSTGSDSSGSVVTVIAADVDVASRRVPSTSRNQGGAKMVMAGSSHKDPSGTLPLLKKEDRPTVRFSNQPPSTSKFLNTNILFIMGLLCCCCCCCYAYNIYMEAEVHIIVHTPVHLLIYRPEVFVRKEAEVKIVNNVKSHELFVDVYDLEDASMPTTTNLCGATCKQSCYSMTGECLCKRGYKLINEDECEDVNECRDLEKPCHKHAHCKNTEGSYSCQCITGYYGDGHECHDCDSSCPAGTYEIQKCSGSESGMNAGKKCAPCSQSCKDGFYINGPCLPHNDTMCKACKAMCSHFDYEYVPCAGSQNRQCRELSSLADPMTSPNIFLENLRDMVVVVSYQVQEERSRPMGTNVLPLTRKSGLVVRITIIEASLAPLYQTVSHSHSHDNSDLKEDMRVLLDYCPYPVPEKYNLTVHIHEGITTKAQYHYCKDILDEDFLSDDYTDNKKKKRKKKKRSLYQMEDNIETCDGDVGYFLNPNAPCHAHITSGNMPRWRAAKRLVCVKPSMLTDRLGISSKFDDVSTTFLDTSSACAKRRATCDKCLTNCAQKMVDYKGSHKCNVTADDADNGESPRLQYCYSCCSKNECSNDCEVYYDKNCTQIRCLTGNLAEITLTPVFITGSPVYACHIEPKPSYKIYDIEYAVFENDNSKSHKPLNDKVFKAVRMYSRENGHPHNAVDQHNFLNISFGSEISGHIDLIEGNIQSKTFKAGRYQAVGRSLDDGVTNEKTFFVRPIRPFAVSKNTWNNVSCDSDVLSYLVKDTSDPFKHDPSIDVHLASKGLYKLFNRTQLKLPYISFIIPADQSLLKAVYGAGIVRDDQTLKADLLRKEKEWNLVVMGELTSCPGAFNIIVRDPLYPHTNLFNYDVGVKCPSIFNLTFNIPTEGPDLFNKTLLLDINDKYRTIKVTVYRPAPTMTQEDLEFFQNNGSIGGPVNYALNQEHPILIMTPPIAVLCIIIICLVIIIFIGIITESDKLDNKKLSGSDVVEAHHYFFVVCYITFKTMYSVAMTFTVLVLLIKHFNKDSMSTLMNFMQYTQTASSSQKLDIEAIHLYARNEIMRQHHIANQTRHDCELKLNDLQEQLENAKQSMSVHRYNADEVTKVAREYTKVLVLNLTRNINKFKQEFTAYANRALDKLKRSIVQTSSAIESSKWMDGPKIIYDAVKKKRDEARKSTKPFLEWAGIKQEVDRLVADLSLKDFPMPNLTEFLNTDIPKSSSQPLKIPRASDVILPRNQWYYHYDKKPPQPSTTEEEDEGADTKKKPPQMMSFTTFIIILMVIDAVWFIHRTARTYYGAQMMLHGCPVFISCRLFHSDCQQEGVNDDVQQQPQQQQQQQQPQQQQQQQQQTQNIPPPPPSTTTTTSTTTTAPPTPTKPSKIRTCLYTLRDINFKIMKTEFIPKMVATVAVGCALYIGLSASDKLLTVKSLVSIGYFDALVAPLETNYRLAGTRVKMNAHRINKLEFPFFEELVNIRYKRYQLLLEMYAEVLRNSAMLKDSEYCMWKMLLTPDAKCNCTHVHVERLHFEGCHLPHVVPIAYHKKDFSEHKEQLIRTILPYIDASRDIIMDTGHLVALFVAILALVDALSNVIWIYFKRFNLLRLKPLFEIEHIPINEEQRN